MFHTSVGWFNKSWQKRFSLRYSIFHGLNIWQPGRRNNRLVRIKNASSIPPITNYKLYRSLGTSSTYFCWLSPSPPWRTVKLPRVCHLYQNITFNSYLSPWKKELAECLPPEGTLTLSYKLRLFGDKKMEAKDYRWEICTIQPEWYFGTARCRWTDPDNKSLSDRYGLFAPPTK